MHKYSLLHVFLLLAFSMQSSAVIVDGKDWMQVKDTSFFTYDDVAGSVCNVVTGICNGTATNNQNNSLNLDGWTWASSLDIESLFETITGAPVGTFSPPNINSYLETKTSAAWADEFVDVDGAGADTGFFHAMTATANENYWVAGVTRTVYDGNKTDRSYIRTTDTHNLAVVRNNVGFDNARVHTGLWFYKTQSVPAPLTLFLFIPALILLALQRSRVNLI